MVVVGRKTGAMIELLLEEFELEMQATREVVRYRWVWCWEACGLIPSSIPDAATVSTAPTACPLADPSLDRKRAQGSLKRQFKLHRQYLTQQASVFCSIVFVDRCCRFIIATNESQSTAATSRPSYSDRGAVGTTRHRGSARAWTCVQEHTGVRLLRHFRHREA